MLLKTLAEFLPAGQINHHSLSESRLQALAIFKARLSRLSILSQMDCSSQANFDELGGFD
jgi:hypothetical protein